MATADKEVSFETVLKNKKALREWIRLNAAIWNGGHYKESEQFGSQELVSAVEVVALQTQLQFLWNTIPMDFNLDTGEVSYLGTKKQWREWLQKFQKLLGFVEAKGR